MMGLPFGLLVNTDFARRWQQDEVRDAVFALRIAASVLLGIGFGVAPVTGLPAFLAFIAVQVVLPNKWFAMQGLDAEEFDSEKAPLMMEGAPPSLMLFVLLWVTSFTIAHGG